MPDYVILTDSSADLSAEMVREAGVTVLPLSFTIQGETYENTPDNREMDPALFYDMLRAGELATTSAVNVAAYTDTVEPLLQAGKDVLILAFSSGMSTTCNSAEVAAEELREGIPSGNFMWWILCAPPWGRACWFGWPPGSRRRDAPLRRSGTGRRPISRRCATSSPYRI